MQRLSYTRETASVPAYLDDLAQSNLTLVGMSARIARYFHWFIDNENEPTRSDIAYWLVLNALPKK